ncbi:MAG: NIPSNAP family protein [Pseudohongiellaceae bacterium]|nr:NIPSNAP family protein [Pseudomonadota bacterium]MEC8995152.1 NIPSNAP family protein [Pseudomonadota bacterium]
MDKILKVIVIPLLSLIVGVGAGIFFTSSAQSEKVFELRTYKATPGNLDNLHARFRNHTTRIFRKHGMEIVGYWSPTSEEEREDTLVYMLEHADLETATASWQAFIADPEWAEVAAASNANGQILGGIEAKYMVATDYSPMQ